jgi:hypothetical protein
MTASIIAGFREKMGTFQPNASDYRRAPGFDNSAKFRYGKPNDRRHIAHLN